jgi:hypothetical protein
MKSLITSAVVVVAVVFPLLSTAAVALRFQALKLQKAKLKADDWTVVAALVSTSRPHLCLLQVY